MQKIAASEAEHRSSVLRIAGFDGKEMLKYCCFVTHSCHVEGGQRLRTPEAEPAPLHVDDVKYVMRVRATRWG